MVDGIVSIPLPGYPCEKDNTTSKGSSNAPPNPFVVGPENRLVEVAVRAVLDESPKNTKKYNPLLLYGASGSGKSHLALGLATAFRAKYRRRAVVCTTGVDFARDLTDAIETQATDEFRHRHRHAGLLVVEDLTRLAEKEVAQLELLNTLDAVLAAGHRVIATATMAPGQWPRMIPSLQSRLGAGLTVPLLPPAAAARLAILRQVTQQRRIGLPESAARLLADGLKVTVPELIGALTELDMHAQMNGTLIDAEAALAYLAKRHRADQVDLPDIARATARAFSLKLSQLRSRTRRREVVTARGVAMYLARQLTDKSLEQIGNYFGGRDHTTVLHGCRKTEALLQTEPELQQAVQRVHNRLQTV